MIQTVCTLSKDTTYNIKCTDSGISTNDHMGYDH